MKTESKKQQTQALEERKKLCDQMKSLFHSSQSPGRSLSMSRVEVEENNEETVIYQWIKDSLMYKDGVRDKMKFLYNKALVDVGMGTLLTGTDIDTSYYDYKPFSRPGKIIGSYNLDLEKSGPDGVCFVIRTDKSVDDLLLKEEDLGIWYCRPCYMGPDEPEPYVSDEDMKRIDQVSSSALFHLTHQPTDRELAMRSSNLVLGEDSLTMLIARNSRLGVNMWVLGHLSREIRREVGDGILRDSSRGVSWKKDGYEHVTYQFIYTKEKWQEKNEHDLGEKYTLYDGLGHRERKRVKISTAIEVSYALERGYVNRHVDLGNMVRPTATIHLSISEHSDIPALIRELNTATKKLSAEIDDDVRNSRSG